MYTPVNKMYPNAAQGGVLGGALGQAGNALAPPRPESQMSIALNEAEAAAGELLSMIDIISVAVRPALTPEAPSPTAAAEGRLDTQIRPPPSDMRNMIAHITATINVGIERLRNLRDRIEI